MRRPAATGGHGIRLRPWWLVWAWWIPDKCFDCGTRYPCRELLHPAPLPFTPPPPRMPAGQHRWNMPTAQLHTVALLDLTPGQRWRANGGRFVS